MKENNMVLGPNIDLAKIAAWRFAYVNIAGNGNHYGTHHSKMILVRYEKGLRVAVTTANFQECDLNYMTNGIYVQDFPLRDKDARDTKGAKGAKEGKHTKEGQEGPNNTFQQDLHEYLSSMCGRPIASLSSFSRRGCHDIRLVEINTHRHMPDGESAYGYEDNIEHNFYSKFIFSLDLYDFGDAYVQLIASIPHKYHGKYKPFHIASSRLGIN